MTNSIRFFALVVSLLQSVLFSKATAQITGEISDIKTRKPIAGVEVFINKTTLAAFTDDRGQFSLKCPLTGFYDFVLYKTGYAVYRSSIKIQANHFYKLNLTLSPSGKRKSVTLTEEENKTLTDGIINSEKTDSSAHLINLENLRTTKKEGQVFFFNNEPLVVRNEATGYFLKFYLMDLPLSEISQAPVRFENLPYVDMQQNMIWEKNKKRYFNSSLRHWLASVGAGTLKADGFSCQDGNGNEMDPSTLVFASSLTGYKKIKLTQPLTVHYQPESGPPEITHITSNDLLDVSEDGVLINPKLFLAKGAMVNVSLSDQIPIDYRPIAGNIDEAFIETMMRLSEKIYVHTDKPYYYPGETIWFKSYVYYYDQAMRDSLSKTLYVELINPKKQIVMEKRLRIDSGFACNNFVLPDKLAEGSYYFRAYTNLNRNFGDSSLFVKVVPILSEGDEVDSLSRVEPKSEESIVITPDKKTYRAREKITLSVRVKEEIHSCFSVSVTDADRVIPILINSNITGSNIFTRPKKVLKWPFSLEKGLGYQVRFLNNKGKPESTPITVIQAKPNTVFLSETDQRGIFSQTGLLFYDTVSFSFKSNKSNSYAYGKFELLPHEVASMAFEDSENQLRLKAMGAHLLQEVVVKGKKMVKPPAEETSTYGKGDVTLTEKDFNLAYTNILYSLVGKVPGLMVDPELNTVVFARSIGSSLLYAPSPLVTVDDQPMTGAGSTLAMLNPFAIERITITKHVNVLYGAQGRAGVIAVYLKKGSARELAESNFQTFEIIGYSAAQTFPSPDYENANTDNSLPDHRTTIYWNPEVSTDDNGQTAISFFSADAPGHYNVIVEGVTEDGETIRGKARIKIER